MLDFRLLFNVIDVIKIYVDYVTKGRESKVITRIVVVKIFMGSVINLALIN